MELTFTETLWQQGAMLIEERARMLRRGTHFPRLLGTDKRLEGAIHQFGFIPLPNPEEGEFDQIAFWLLCQLNDVQQNPAEPEAIAKQFEALLDANEDYFSHIFCLASPNQVAELINSQPQLLGMGSATQSTWQALRMAKIGSACLCQGNESSEPLTEAQVEAAISNSEEPNWPAILYWLEQTGQLVNHTQLTPPQQTWLAAYQQQLNGNQQALAQWAKDNDPLQLPAIAQCITRSALAISQSELLPAWLDPSLSPDEYCSLLVAHASKEAQEAVAHMLGRINMAEAAHVGWYQLTGEDLEWLPLMQTVDGEEETDEQLPDQKAAQAWLAKHHKETVPRYRLGQPLNAANAGATLLTGIGKPYIVLVEQFNQLSGANVQPYAWAQHTLATLQPYIASFEQEPETEQAQNQTSEAVQ